MKLVELLAIAALAASPAAAQGPGGFGRGGMMRTPVFAALDSDGDGSISASEIANAPAALKTLDKNGDGRLTEDEVRPAFGRGGREGGRIGREGGRGDRGAEPRGAEPGEAAGPSADELVQTLMAFDKNGDGKLTRDEVPERMQGLFERADTDKNGILTVEEIRKAAQAQAAPGGSGGREGGRGPGMSFMRMDPILAALDTDGDGVISAAEIAAAPVSLLKLDKNQDGKLTTDEVRVNMGFGRGRQ